MAKIDFCNKQPISTDSIKDWRDAFLESVNGEIMESETHGLADAINVVHNLDCTSLQCLMNYCSSFTNGGVWIDPEDGVFFVTSRIGSDPEATYEDAKQFIENYRQAKQLSV